jgi:hypothetical protein
MREAGLERGLGEDMINPDCGITMPAEVAWLSV